MNEHRHRAYQIVTKHLEPLHGEVLVPFSGKYSRAKTRNLLAEYAVGDVLVFNDADTIVPLDQILEAMTLAAEAPGLVYGYDLYVRLTREGTEAYTAGDDEDMLLSRPIEKTFTNSGSMGCVAIQAECFRAVGGFDESYVGWGWEDIDFAMRCGDRWPARRVPGPAYHLWHGDRNDDDSPDDANPDEVRANFARWKTSMEKVG
jgi:GT2 family glycosyltransferase